MGSPEEEYICTCFTIWSEWLLHGWVNMAGRKRFFDDSEDESEEEEEEDNYEERKPAKPPPPAVAADGGKSLSGSPPIGGSRSGSAKGGRKGHTATPKSHAAARGGGSNKRGGGNSGRSASERNPQTSLPGDTSVSEGGLHAIIKTTSSKKAPSGISSLTKQGRIRFLKGYHNNPFLAQLFYRSNCLLMLTEFGRLKRLKELDCLKVLRHM